MFKTSYLSKHHMLAIQPGCWHCAQEELAAIGVATCEAAINTEYLHMARLLWLMGNLFIYTYVYNIYLNTWHIKNSLA